MKNILIGIVVIVLGVLAVVWLGGGAKKISGPVPTPRQSVAILNTAPNTSLPAGFPSGLPLEAVILQNYSTINPNGQALAVHEFISKKTLTQNFAIYKSALPAAGWTLSNIINNSDQKIISAQKGKTQLRVRIYPNTSKQTVVSLQAITK